MAATPGKTVTDRSSLASALLLAATGGTLDAVTYLAHGHVFANAMTGNVIFLGIALVSESWANIPAHVTPILAYLAGVSAARLLQTVPLQHSTRITLSLEIVALFLVGLLAARLPQQLFVAIVAFVSAFQVTTFRRVGRFTFNSTFVTGNLRDVVDGAWQHWLENDPARRWFGREKAINLGLVCLTFLAGAMLGGWVVAHHLAHDLWFAEAPLVAALALTFTPNAATAT